jgi:RNA polymerase sporulation-specific sigma factor
MVSVPLPWIASWLPTTKIKSWQIPDPLLRAAKLRRAFFRKKDGQAAIEYSGGEASMYATVWLMLTGMMYALQLQSGSFPKPLTAQEERYYLDLAAKGDINARNILIERNLRLVAHIMKKYYAITSDQEDLISIGTIGLIKGISTFDAGKGARLATYAARCVENEILMHFRSQKKSAQDVSLSDLIETGTDGAALSLMDVVSDDDDLLETVSNRQALQTLRRAVKETLTEQEQQVIDLRYGLTLGTPLRQREVADKTGISRSYVSRIEKRALEKLRAVLGDI